MPTKKTTTPKTAPKPKLPSIQVRVDRVNEGDSSVKAFVSANIGDAFAIHGIKVIDSQKGLFVSMPQSSYQKADGKTKYNDIFHAVTAEARAELNSKVMEAYEQAIGEQQSEEETEEEAHGLVQSM